MPLPTLYEACQPRADVLLENMVDSEFAADLAQVLKGEAPSEYRDPVLFFENTYPTEGLKKLFACVCSRLSGAANQMGSIFRLDTNYGGGKTHALIALAHVARNGKEIPSIKDFVDPEIVPSDDVLVAAFDGENADPTNGRKMGDGIRAYTPWGELAYQLAGRKGYESIRNSDEEGIAPGAENIRDLFGDKPTLILMDELSVLLRKIGGSADASKISGQMSAFLTGLFKAVESAPRAALVYTLALGKGGKATDAYAKENEKLSRIIASSLAEMESISARKSTPLDPTTEDETVLVLKKRLFSKVFDDRAGEIADAYTELWRKNRERIPVIGPNEDRRETFLRCFPFHPELIDTLTTKTATLENFQRVRGMLRLLARTIARLWTKKPTGTYAIHTGNIDPSYSPIRQEFLTKLGMDAYAPALKSDIAAAENDVPSLAERIDGEYIGQAPYGSLIARTIFMHTLAYNDMAQGANSYELYYSMLSPSVDIPVTANVIREFQQQSAYLDDRPDKPLRFRIQPNLNQIIRQKERGVDAEEARLFLNDAIRKTFKGKDFDDIFSPASPNEIEDRPTKPKLVMLGYEAVFFGLREDDSAPDLAKRLFENCTADGKPRQNRNNLVFVVADESKVDDMKAAVRRRLALHDISNDVGLKEELAAYQREKVAELYKKSESELFLSIQQAYRHLFYPSSGGRLEHTALEVDAASAKPGLGQKSIVAVLIKAGQFCDSVERMKSCDFIEARKALGGGVMSTQALFKEYKEDTTWPILSDSSLLEKWVSERAEEGRLTYVEGQVAEGSTDGAISVEGKLIDVKGAIVYAQGTPKVAVKISDNALLMTKSYFGEKVRPCMQGEDGGSDGESESETGSRTTGDDSDNDFFGYDNDESATEVTKEGVLREALVHAWEEAQQRKIAEAGRLEISVFNPSDVALLLSPVAQIPGCQADVYVKGSYQTSDGSTCTFEYNGTPKSAGLPINFLSSQLRSASNSNIKAVFTLAFSDGLSIVDEISKDLNKRLGVALSCHAFVKLIAKD